jgi:hypothetical protein
LLIKDRDARMPDAGTAARILAQASLVVPPPASGSVSGPGSSLGGWTVPPVEVAAATATVTPAPGSAIPRRWLWLGGGVVAVLIVIAAWPTGDTDPSSDPSETEGSASAPATPLAAAIPALVARADAQVFVEIDRELIAHNAERALELIGKARDHYPEDPALMWREGRAMAMSTTDADRVIALRRYADALAGDDTLADETEFVAELRNLLRDPALRPTAVDLAVRELGPLGHSFLLETINDEDIKLSYVDRHRILDELAVDPLLRARVDERRQLDLDLRQAATSPTPCTAFAEALERVADSDDPMFLAALSSRDLDVPASPGVEEDTSDCEGLAAERDQVKATLAAAHPQEAAKQEKASSKKKKKRGFRLPF